MNKEIIVLRPISDKQRSCLDCDYGTAFFIAGELLVLLIDFVFKMFEKRKSRKNKK